MSGSGPQISYEDALRIVLEHAPRLDDEGVPLRDAPGRVLTRDVVADRDLPPFDRSAMDGFACRREDLGSELTVVATLPAGAAPGPAVGPGECVRIMTGAPVPAGADMVFMVEESAPLGPDRVRFTGTDSASNILRRGEDLVAGALLLAAGTRLRPDHIALLAAAGVPEPRVARRPRVGIVATGDELVEPGEDPGPFRIRNSNAHQLVAQVASAGGVPEYHGIARDHRELLEEAIERAAAGKDLLLLSGGVSQGDFDLVPEVLRARGVRILFDRVRIKPGKPTTFGVGPEGPCFGLPGNPVSTFVIFEILVRPLLQAMTGQPWDPGEWATILHAPVRRRRAERDEWIPVTRTPEGGVVPVSYHGSSHVAALAGSHGLLRVPVGISLLPEGTTVRVRPLPA